MRPAERPPPSFGLYLPQVNRGYRDLLSFAKAAEQCGFTAVWLMDHLVLPGRPGPVLEGWTLATALAAATSRIRIGHLVLCDSFRHPVLLGSMAATLDHISEGRLNLGLGWGSSPTELRLLGRTPASAAGRAGRLAESIAIISAVLDGRDIDHRGAHFIVAAGGIGPGAARRRVPLFIGGASERTMKLVREHADWWNCPAMERRRLAQLTPLAGSARISVNYSLAVTPRPVGRPRPGSFPLTGTAAEIAEVLRADRALGAEHFVIQFTDPAVTPAELERFMTEIAPAVGGPEGDSQA